MNAGAITPEVVIEALVVMAEARARLGRDTAPGDFEIAKRVAVAEGRLREQLMQALPKDLPIRSAA